MSERLAIKTDKVDAWSKGNIGQVVKELSPRPVDDGRKSSWAHCEEHGELPAVLDDPAKATCELQALAMFMFSQIHSPGRRSRVTGVSLRRSVIREDLVAEDAMPHPIPAYSVTHRALLMSDEQERQTTARTILAESAFDGWEYSREEMADLLERLLNENRIDPSMQREARSLLSQWSS